VYADNGADLERRDVHENVVAINHAPLVTVWRGTQVILGLVDFITAIPVLLLDGYAFPPFLVLDVSVVVMMVLGSGHATHETCGKDRER
jgi:hypothetical protein